MTCAQTNYFCRAQGGDEGCSAAWSRCVTACIHPELDPAAGASP